MRKKLIAGNWKMNGSLVSAVELAETIVSQSSSFNGVQVAVFPNFVFIPLISELLHGSSIAVGAQNVSEHGLGAFTGEVEANMLHEVGCSMVLVGHSERRSLYYETDLSVAMKFMKAQASGLTPILCVGETLTEREAEQTSSVVLCQLNVVLSQAGIHAFQKAVIAYEPVWAIGTGKTATPEQAEEVHAILRHRLAELDAGVAAKCQILYGGSVKADNAAQLFTKPDIDGALVGGASLKADEFISICQAAV